MGTYFSKMASNSFLIFHVVNPLTSQSKKSGIFIPPFTCIGKKNENYKVKWIDCLDLFTITSSYPSQRKTAFLYPPSQNSCSYAEKSGNKKSRANQSTQPMLYLTDLYDSGNTTAYAVISFMITTS